MPVIAGALADVVFGTIDDDGGVGASDAPFVSGRFATTTSPATPTTTMAAATASTRCDGADDSRSDLNVMTSGTNAPGSLIGVESAMRARASARRSSSFITVPFAERAGRGRDGI